MRRELQKQRQTNETRIHASRQNQPGHLEKLTIRYDTTVMGGMAMELCVPSTTPENNKSRDMKDWTTATKGYGVMSRKPESEIGKGSSLLCIYS